MKKGPPTWVIGLGLLLGFEITGFARRRGLEQFARTRQPSAGIEDDPSLPAAKVVT